MGLVVASALWATAPAGAAAAEIDHYGQGPNGESLVWTEQSSAAATPHVDPTMVPPEGVVVPDGPTPPVNPETPAPDPYSMSFPTGVDPIELIDRPDPQRSGDTSPFDYTVDFNTNLRSRDFQISRSTICISFRRDYRQIKSDSSIKVQLAKNGPIVDTGLDTLTFSLDGNANTKCFSKHETNRTYHLTFSKVTYFGYRITGHGSVYW